MMECLFIFSVKPTSAQLAPMPPERLGSRAYGVCRYVSRQPAVVAALAVAADNPSAALRRAVKAAAEPGQGGPGAAKERPASAGPSELVRVVFPSARPARIGVGHPTGWTPAGRSSTWGGWGRVAPVPRGGGGQAAGAVRRPRRGPAAVRRPVGGVHNRYTLGQRRHLLPRPVRAVRDGARENSPLSTTAGQAR